MVEEYMVNWVYVLLLFILGFITYYRKSLDLFGAAVMIIMGVVIIFSAGANWLGLIVLFLIMSLIATKFSKKYKMSLGEFEGRRTSKNVISNGVVACFMAAFGGYYSPFVGGFIGAIATATADTLASEIGVLDHHPRLITTFQKVDPGFSFRYWNCNCGCCDNWYCFILVGNCAQSMVCNFSCNCFRNCWMFL